MAEINSLGSFLPVLNQGISLITKADRLFGTQGSTEAQKQARARSALNLNQLEERQAVEGQIADRKNEREMAALAAQGAEDERRRLSALKRVSAKQRAAFGGAGVESDAGSGEAVLLGLFSESEQEKGAQESINALRRQILSDNAAAFQTRNLLELAQARTRYALLSE